MHGIFFINCIREKIRMSSLLSWLEKEEEGEKNQVVMNLGFMAGLRCNLEEWGGNLEEE